MRYTFFPGKYSAGLNIADVFVGKKLTFADQFVVIYIEIIGNERRTKSCRKLRSQVFRQRLNLKQRAAGFVHVNLLAFTYPAFRIHAVSSKFRRGRRKIEIKRNSIEGRFTDDFTERIFVKRHLIPHKIRRGGLNP